MSVASMNYADLLDLTNQVQWRIPDSNWGHTAYESVALPTELMRQGWLTFQLLPGRWFVGQRLMNPLLFQLSYRAMCKCSSISLEYRRLTHDPAQPDATNGESRASHGDDYSLDLGALAWSRNLASESAFRTSLRR